ncbi:hypothetical protein PhCBS80983_g00860 [Powellomyces hirtus]|uniref:Uncharacterized protein n=1 Tax=Powellomyces hirtus TaxID=109895 RepID=A0A507EDQ0_9FUNG|nr:hypothetical protein PhCBS80983_g00860 [Powellomyces hirtus]
MLLQPAGPLALLLSTALSLSSSVAATTPNIISRYDRPSPSSPNVIPHTFPESHDNPDSSPSSSPSSFQHRLHRRAPTTNSQFDITFKCPDSSAEQCQWAQNGFERAGAYISSLLTIPTQLKVHATFKSFCKNKPYDECGPTSSILGYAAPAAYFPARPSTAILKAGSPLAASWFLYPQALVKQLRYDTDLQFATFDIVADFNSDIRTWWFKDSPKPITANQTDFDYVITHELTHGLGWDTSLLSFDQVFTDIASKTTPYVAPSVYFHGSSGAPVADAWTFLTSFDALIKDTKGRAVTDYLTPVQSWWGSDAPNGDGEPNGLRSFIASFEASGGPFSAAESLSKAIVAAPKSLRVNQNTSLFTVADDKNVGFEMGSSITHLDYTSYMNSQEFLMVPYDNNGRGTPLMDIVKRNNGTGVYGPESLQIMRSMGWGIGGAPSAIDLTIGKNIQVGDAFSLAIRMEGGVLLGLATGLLTTLVTLV